MGAELLVQKATKSAEQTAGDRKSLPLGFDGRIQ
jgi:hypothetical protein